MIWLIKVGILFKLFNMNFLVALEKKGIWSTLLIKTYLQGLHKYWQNIYIWYFCWYIQRKGKLQAALKIIKQPQRQSGQRRPFHGLPAHMTRCPFPPLNATQLWVAPGLAGQDSWGLLRSEIACAPASACVCVGACVGCVNRQVILFTHLGLRGGHRPPS